MWKSGALHPVRLITERSFPVPDNVASNLVNPLRGRITRAQLPTKLHLSWHLYYNLGRSLRPDFMSRLRYSPRILSHYGFKVNDKLAAKMARAQFYRPHSGCGVLIDGASLLLFGRSLINPLDSTGHRHGPWLWSPSKLTGKIETLEPQPHSEKWHWLSTLQENNAPLCHWSLSV